MNTFGNVAVTSGKLVANGSQNTSGVSSKCSFKETLIFK